MLVRTPILRGFFGQHYVIGKTPFIGVAEPLFGKLGHTQTLVNSLHASRHFWKGFLTALDGYESHYPRPDSVLAALAGRLAGGGGLHAFKVPSEQELEDYRQYERVHAGIRYRLLPANSHFIPGIKAVKPFHLEERDALIEGLGLSEQQLTEILAKLPPPKKPLPVRSRFYWALNNYQLVVTADPVYASAATINRPVETTYHAKAPSLGPHDSPDYVPPPPNTAPALDQAPNTPAQSLADCEHRLGKARERLQAEGYQPKYSDEEIRATAQQGELDDRFIIRFTQNEYAEDHRYLSKIEPDGSTRTWVSTFNQLENADTNPATIASVLGITYNPEASYSVIIVDTHAPAAGQAVTIVPTYENLGKMAKSEIEGIDPKFVDEVMTEEYSKVYAEVMEVFIAENVNIEDSEEVEEFAAHAFDNPKDVARFEVRLRIQERYGANQHYTGNGTTKNLLPDGGDCGALEVLNIDKNPQTIGKLIAGKAAKRLSCTSI